MHDKATFQIEESRIREVYSKRIGKDRTTYSLLHPANLFMIQERERQVLKLLNRKGIDDLSALTILELGCGDGFWQRAFIQWGADPANLLGIDLVSSNVLRAERLTASPARFRTGSAMSLPLEDKSYDLVLQSTMFTSILDPAARRQVAAEMLRVVREDGLIFWYDYRYDNPSNSDVRGISHSEITELFPNAEVDLRSITLAPPISRMLARHCWLGCVLLERIPWLRTHYLGAIQKKTL